MDMKPFTDEEITLLSGKVSDEAQLVVDQCLERVACVERHPDLGVPHAKFIADVLHEARVKGILDFRCCSLRYCKLCGLDGGYAAYSRNGKYHRKGDLNYDKPRTISGVDLAKSAVRFMNHPVLGCCTGCFKKLKPALLIELQDVRAELPEKLTGAPPRFKRQTVVKCEKCDWTGPESRMRSDWRGSAKLGCGNTDCDAVNNFIDRKIRPTGDYDLVALPKEAE